MIVEDQSTIYMDDTVSLTKEKLEELDSQIVSLMEKNVKQWICKVCGKVSSLNKSRKQIMMSHVEAKHLANVNRILGPGTVFLLTLHGCTLIKHLYNVYL